MSRDKAWKVSAYTHAHFSCCNQLNMLGYDEDLYTNLTPEAFIIQISFQIAASQPCLTFHFNSTLYCLPLLSFKNSIFSSLSESQLSLDIVFFSQSDTLPLLFWHVRHTMSPETIKCFCAPAAIICLYGNGLKRYCIAWYSVWSISVSCTAVKTSHLHL